MAQFADTLLEQTRQVSSSVMTPDQKKPILKMSSNDIHCGGYSRTKTQVTEKYLRCHADTERWISLETENLWERLQGPTNDSLSHVFGQRPQMETWSYTVRSEQLAQKIEAIYKQMLSSGLWKKNHREYCSTGRYTDRSRK